MGLNLQISCAPRLLVRRMNNFVMEGTLQRQATIKTLTMVGSTLLIL